MGSLSSLGYLTVFRYDDFVDGDRVQRIYAALRPGLSALTCVLFFDSINRDKKGFLWHVSCNVYFDVSCDVFLLYLLLYLLL